MLNRTFKVICILLTTLAFESGALAADQGLALGRGYVLAEDLLESMDSLLKGDIQDIPDAASALASSRAAVLELKTVAKEGLITDSEPVFALKYASAKSKLAIARSSVTRALIAVTRYGRSESLKEDLKAVGAILDKALAPFDPQ